MTTRKEIIRPGYFQVVLLCTLVAACSTTSLTAEIPQKEMTAAPLPPVSTTAKSQAPTSGPTAILSTTTREKDGMRMVQIEAGEFSMGSETGEPDELPVHQVFLDAYRMDETEVTNAMYAACVEIGACRPPLDMGSYTRDHYFEDQRFANFPVIHVDWAMAAAYCKWTEARLPSEAEWEFAARGTRDSIYPWGNEWDVAVIKRLNFADRNNPEAAFDQSLDDGFADTSPVASFPAGRSGFGLYDLAGNVWEWVSDWYDPNYYTNSPHENPTGPSEPPQDLPEKRVLRGGSWVASQDVFLTANRNGLEPSKSSTSIGFRCAR